LSQEEMEAIKKEGDDVWAQQEYYARFVEGIDDKAVIDVFLVDTAIGRVSPVLYDEEEVIGLDVAGEGSNKTVFVRKKGYYGEVLSEIIGRTKPNEVVAQAIEYLNQYPSAVIHADGNGVGWGVISRLHDMGFADRVLSINTAERCDMEEQRLKFRNKRAYGWFATLDWLDEGGKLSQHSGWHELSKPRYNKAGDGRIKVESKESMSRRGVKSTDYADALCLTFLTPSPEKKREGYKTVGRIRPINNEKVRVY